MTIRHPLLLLVLTLANLPVPACTNQRTTFNIDGLSREANTLLGGVAAGTNSLVVFDADGTIWRDDVGVDFFLWQLDNAVLHPENMVAATRAWRQFGEHAIDEREMWTLTATCQSGLREEHVAAFAKSFFDDNYRDRIYPPIRQAIELLQTHGVDIWIVSASQKWIVEAGARHVDIPPSRVIAVTARVKEGVITAEPIEPIPLGAGKAEAIHRIIGRRPAIVVGNSGGDIEMLQLATQNSIVVNPDKRLTELAQSQGWLVERIR